MIHTAISGNPSIVNYTMFVAIFGALSLLYLIPTTAKESLAVPIVTLALDGLNTLFWLIGGIALAAELDVHSCNNSVSHTTSAPPQNLYCGAKKHRPRKS